VFCRQKSNPETFRGLTYTALATSLAICIKEHVASKVLEMWLGESFSLGGQLLKYGSRSGETNGTGMA
jgi:hypothetical protein